MMWGSHLTSRLLTVFQQGQFDARCPRRKTRVTTTMPVRSIIDIKRIRRYWIKV